MTPAFSIRQAEPVEASTVARLHGDAIPTAFLTSLGTKVLTQVYRAMIASPRAVLLVAVDEGQRILGFVGGTTSVRDFYLDFAMSRYAWYVAWSLLTSHGRHILPLWSRALETLRYPFRKNTTPADLPSAELLSIAVVEEVRGTRVAVKLMEALKCYFKQCGVSEFKVVVGAENLRACRYYEKMGGRLIAQIEVHRGGISHVYGYEID